MKRLALTLAIVAAAAVAQQPRISRASFAAAEKAFDKRVEEIFDNPFLVIGNTRGIYLQGFGTIFTCELNLVPSAITPFRPEPTKDEIARLRQKKLERLPHLRQTMREMLAASAASLDNMPPQENLVLGVSLFHHRWEDTAGLPNQIIMQAVRKRLLEARGNPQALEAALKVQEF